MCTVIVHVPSPDERGAPVRLIAVRDEDPGRPWDALGEWWPREHPGVVGVRDARAGGAWLAAAPAEGRLAVLLNRLDLSSRTDAEVTSRGAIPLDAVAGRPPGDEPSTRGFNLVEVAPDGVRVIAWDGLERRETPIGPGTHMIAHDDLDDEGSPRIARWLAEFRGTDPGDDGSGWLGILARSAELPGDAPEAIIRDDAYEGIPSVSLLACVATIGNKGVDVRYGVLPEPGRWGEIDWQGPLRPPA